MSDPTQNAEVDVAGEVQNEEAGATAQAIPTVGTVPVIQQQPPQPLQPTPQDFSSLLLMMQQQIQGQNLMYQSQMENLQQQHKEQLLQQKLQMETILSQNKAIDELKKELDEAKAANSKEQGKRPDRPVIHAGQTDNQWLLFLDTWERYKERSKLTKLESIRNELREVCVNDVNELLFELYGPQQLNSMSEDQLLGAIHKVAVESVHEEVHRQNFFRMKQDIGEPIKKFMARLKAKANMCNFKVDIPCAHMPAESAGMHLVSFSEAMLCHQLVSGLVDEEWKEKMLSEADTLNSLSKKFDRLLCMEAVGKSTPKLAHGQPQETSKSAASKSAYKKGKKVPKGTSNKQSPQQCDYCGQPPHERKDCPASGKTCNKCNKVGHFASVCQSTNQNPSKSATAQAEMPQSSQPINQQQPSMSSAATCPNQDFRLGLEGGSFL